MEQYTLFEFYYSPVEGSTENVNKNVFFSQTSKDYRLLNGACFLHQYCKQPQKKRKEACYELRQQQAHKQTLAIYFCALDIYGFLVKRVPCRGPEQRESYKTVLYPLIVIIINQLY